jgi:hypothetical protein
MQATTDLQKQVDKNLQKLRTVRDEVRLHAHLFNMELKEAWEKLEPKLTQAELKAKKATEASAVALGGAIEALIEFQSRTKKQ